MLTSVASDSMSKPPSLMTDLEDRDPNSLSQHLQVSWDEVIGEPETIRSPECAWKVSNQCFSLAKNLCYTSLSVLVAPIVAFCLGCAFACLAFEHIWCIIPLMRMWRIWCAATRTVVMSCSQAIIVPIAEALGSFWSGIKVRSQSLPEGPDRKQDILMV